MPESIDPKGPRSAAANEPTGQLIRETFDEVVSLAKLEVALAREDITREIAGARASAMALGLAGGVAIAGVSLLLVAFALTFERASLVALAIGAVLVLAAVAMGVYGWRRLPVPPMNQTKERVQSDLKQIRERVA
jgi:hypothetical protein